MRKHLGLLIIALLVPACSSSERVSNISIPTPVEQATQAIQATDTPEPSPTPTSIPPTETPLSQPSPVPFQVIEDVPYVVDGDYKQKLDIYVPEGGRGPFPTLLTIHGGYGDKKDLERLSRYFAERGYAVVSINYRGMPYDAYPAEIQDTFCALAWTYANADTYSFDLERIVAVGHSAGGTAAAMLGVVDDPSHYLEGCPHTLPEPNWVRGVAAFTGMFDYARAASFSSDLHEYIVEYLGGEQDEVPEIWTEASPATWVDGNDPPFLLVHGRSDKSISPGESTEFAATLEEAGVNVELELISGATHAEIMRSKYFDIVETFVAALSESE